MRRNVGVPKQSKKRAQLEIDRIAINMYEIFPDSAARREGGFERMGCSAAVGGGRRNRWNRRYRSKTNCGGVVDPGTVIGQEFVNEWILQDFQGWFPSTGDGNNQRGGIRALFRSSILGPGARQCSSSYKCNRNLD